MPEVLPRSGRRSSDSERVRELLAHDFPGVRLAVSEHVADLAAGRADGVAVRTSELPFLPADDLTFFAFPEHERVAGLALLFRSDDAVLREVRRFYLPPVHLVGAGPGGTGTLTVAGARAVAAADIVLVDCLCGEEVLRDARADAEIVHVGKRCGKAQATQQAINDSLVHHALRGRRVVRLKGGDPSVFGRLEEEIGALADQRLPYRILPGIGAASAAAAFIGHPLTARDVASELILSTGRLAGGGKNPFPLREGSAPAIALYMSRRVLDERMRDLVGAGYPPETPATVVEQLGSPRARAVTGTVANLAAIADQEGVGTPAVVLVGGHIGAPDHLPLHGVRIWLPAEAETGLAQREPLEALGAVCTNLPLIEPVALPVEEGRLLSGSFDWVLFTSKRSPHFFFDLLRRWGFDARWLPRVAAIGDPCVEALREHGIEPDLVPPEPTRVSLCASLIQLGLEGKRVLIPASEVAPDHVRQQLLPHAAAVERVDLYTLRFPRVEAVPDVDLVLFSSESTVRSAKASGLTDEIRRRGLVVGGIGPGTWAAIEREGLLAAIRPDGTDPEALARATRRLFARGDVARLAGSPS